jgi:hypothetical protein
MNSAAADGGGDGFFGIFVSIFGFCTVVELGFLSSSAICRAFVTSAGSSYMISC